MNNQPHSRGYRRFPLILALIYFVPATYIGVFGNEWRLLFHYAATYPMGIAVDYLAHIVDETVLVGPVASISQTRWAVANAFEIGAYILVGTAWYYLIGCALRFIWGHFNRGRTRAEPAG